MLKLLQFGVRHGHRVIVNRQLCIANAFEQIFLAVIYLCDTKPENRIAMQYITPMRSAKTDMGQKACT